MKKTFIWASTALLMLTAAQSWAVGNCGARSVALTFDDAPLPDTVIMTGAERTERIIHALNDGGVNGVMFFSVTSRIDDDSIVRMRDYAKAGHVIASHTHTHPNLHQVGSQAFLEDVERAHEVLSQLPGFEPYFRFPYLNEGASAEERDAVRVRLSELGYRAGYVTIDNYDFYIDRLLREATEQHRDVDLEAAGDLYVEMILAAAAHYDAIACKWLRRSPKHILLMHENDAAALFLPKLIAAFIGAGWELISAEDAYSDPIAEVVPDTLFLGQGRVAALAEIAGADPTDLRHEGESTVTLRERFESLIQSRSKDDHHPGALGRP